MKTGRDPLSGAAQRHSQFTELRRHSLQAQSQPKRTRITVQGRELTLKRLSNLSSNKTLQGIFVEGHGIPSDFHNSDYSWTVPYSAVEDEVQYKLGAVLLNVCNGGWCGSEMPGETPPSEVYGRWKGFWYYQMYGNAWVEGAGKVVTGGYDLVSPNGAKYGLKKGLNPFTENLNVRDIFPGGEQGTN